MSLFLFAAVLLSQSTSTFRFSDDDLAAYRKALSGDGHEVSKPVEFLDLWQHGDVHRGRVVSLSGRVVRQFHVPALEGFPPRNELWLSKGENLICAVVREESPVKSYRSRCLRCRSIVGDGQISERRRPETRALDCRTYLGGACLEPSGRVALSLVDPDPSRARDRDDPDLLVPFPVATTGEASVGNR